MTVRPDTSATASDDMPDATRSVARGALVRWLLSYGTFSVPQAAGPIVFALLAIPLTGDPGSGATIVLAITIAQVVGAIIAASILYLIASGKSGISTPDVSGRIGIRIAPRVYANGCKRSASTSQVHRRRAFLG